ncbi:flap endonuclease-1 [Candidatus Woesearchaeota archaeon]|nr:flap endonuclease-1 [Candidatus Woesearchaeota archaeon]
MGVAMSGLLKAQETSIEELHDKVIAVDAMNMLYQFVTTIRQQDGTPLKDSKGNITSHLTGLFARTTRMLQKGLKLVFVFDGEMPTLKAAERARRNELKEKAREQLEKATANRDITQMKKLSSRTAKITSEIIQESKDLLTALGIPIIQAPSEGEAQAAFMVSRGDCDFVASQDVDCLIYGGPKMIRNLGLSPKRKKINALTYKTIQPEIITLNHVLKELDISLHQLRALAMLVGTDFNIGGVKGLGPKKGLTLVKKFGDDLEGLFTEVNFQEECAVYWKDVFDTIAKMPTTDEYELEWKSIDKEALNKLLVEDHDFSTERVNHAIEALEKEKKSSQQTSLGNYF